MITLTKNQAALVFHLMNNIRHDDFARAIEAAEAAKDFTRLEFTGEFGVLFTQLCDRGN
jgi:hypothetical protein